MIKKDFSYSILRKKHSKNRKKQIIFHTLLQHILDNSLKKIPLSTPEV